MNILAGIWILAAVPLVVCQNGRTEDFLHFAPESPNESITNYSNSHSESRRNMHPIDSLYDYHVNDGKDEKNQQENSSNIARSDYRRKIFHIKNPFQHQFDQNEGSDANEFNVHDSNAGASDQYAAMQYSLPPEEFFQRMRAEEQLLQQMSTSAPVEYAATPQPQYQYSFKSQNYYNPNQIPQLEQKDPNILNYQNPLISPASYSYNTLQSTPSSVSSISSYISTVLPDLQYVGTPANSQSYMSSASNPYLSSTSNSPQYDSYPISTFQSLDQNNHLTTSTNTFTYNNNDAGKTLQIYHYDNSANGIRHPLNVQYQNEVSSTTFGTPVSSIYTDATRELWQDAIGANSLSKSVQEVNAISQYKNQIQNSLQESQPVSGHNDLNTRTMNNLISANNVVRNFARPGYSPSYEAKSRTTDLEQVSAQPQQYSYGDYGWKLSAKNPLTDTNSYSVISFGHLNPQTKTFHSNNPLDTVDFQNKLHNTQTLYQQQSTALDNSHSSKTPPDSHEAKEFAKAAAKVHENMKQLTKTNKQYYHYNHAPNHGSNNVQHSLNEQANIVSTFYGNNEQQPKYIMETPNNEHSDLVTASPFYYSNKRESVDSKGQQPFDHVKALKNIEPIDESNVLENVNLKISSLPNSNQYYVPNYKKELELSDQLSNKPFSDAYYRDKSSEYGLNIKAKLDDMYPSEAIKSLHPNIAMYSKEHRNQDYGFNQGLYSAQSAGGIVPRNNFLLQTTNSYQENIQQPSNTQLLQNAQTRDLNSVLRLNDIPYKFTQGLTANALKLHNSNFDHGYTPQPMPSKINQNVGSHQLDVTNSILNKILSINRQIGLPVNQNNNFDLQTGSSMPAINSFKVINPYNVDLKLFTDILKGKPAVDETRMALLREQFSKPIPLKLDMSTLQQLLLKDGDYGLLKPYTETSLSNGATIVRNPFLDIYSNIPNPHRGLTKYSRSQEEEESIVPLAESINAHPMGTIEQDVLPNRQIPGVKDLTTQNEYGVQEPEADFENLSKRTMSMSRHKKKYKGNRHSSSLILHPGYQAKHSESNIEEPYPLLKPPPPINRGTRAMMVRNKNERRGHRKRFPSKIYRTKKLDTLFKSDTLIEAESESPPILLKPPPEDKPERTKE